MTTEVQKFIDAGLIVCAFMLLAWCVETFGWRKVAAVAVGIIAGTAATVSMVFVLLLACGII